MNLQHLTKNKKYLLAVSGGIDSMVMATLFLFEKIPFEVAHCNFKLRENDSELDEQLVQKWCSNNNITFHCKQIDTKNYSETNHISIQEAARKIRYSYFEELAKKNNVDYIATAHHKEDNVETSLFHFLRGTGINGIVGIPFQNNLVIRPLLSFSKKEIINFANENKVTFRDDLSNFKTTYTRNKIRLELIPQIENFIPTVQENIAQNIARFKDINEIYLQQIDLYRKKLIEKRGLDYYIPILKLQKTNPVKTILYELLKPFGFGFEQTCEALKLLERQTGTWIESNEYKIIKNRNFLIITKKTTEKSDTILIQKEDNHCKTAQFLMKIETKPYLKKPIEKSANCCSIDASLIEFPLLLRKLKLGDYIYPFGMSKKKKVSKILIDKKIPLHEKK